MTLAIDQVAFQEAAEPSLANAAQITGLASVPASVKAILLACLNIRSGALIVRLPDARALRFGDGDGPAAALNIRDFRFAARVLAHGDIGLAEGWIANEWESPNLAALLTLLAANVERFLRLFNGGVVSNVLHWLSHAMRPNTRGGAKRNILAHYDLGNRFYAAWLDRSMTYSSARFLAAGGSLEAAQAAKYRTLAEHLRLRPSERVLEIGCGWGGFAEFAAREYGARVTAITISDEQFHYARERIGKAGLADRVEIRRQDYRDVEGQFDKVASIEMFEAVGEKYWPTFFNKVTAVLKPGGRAGLQIITIQDQLFDQYRRRTDFIQRYVFPGGMLASVARLRDEVADAGLLWRKSDAFGQSYAETLAEWGRRFQAQWAEISALGFDERFKRLWLFYLGYCEAGFRTGRTNVVQLALEKP
jgi:cyclopropane-fatty-acyl-phospholipid synthase